MSPDLEALLVETTERAVRHWGYKAQLQMVAEECAELIVAIAHMQRERTDAYDEAYDGVVEAAAAVTIALRYVRYVVGDERIDRAIAARLARLRKRLAKECAP